MKQAWADLKSFITIVFTLTLVILLVIVALKENWELFQIVFVLFSNLATAVFTYFFTKKKESVVNDVTNPEEIINSEQDIIK